jgi:hypothetical protein
MSDGITPPPSVFPRLADRSAVTAESTAATLGAIPNLRFPDRVTRVTRLEFGPEAVAGIMSELPPKSGAEYAAWVSAVDPDGNELAGIRPVELSAPLATVTGWNPRHPEQGSPGDLMAMMGSTLPFARTAAERERRGDPRPSIAERYASREAYLATVREAAEALVAARYALAEDVEGMVERAGRLWDLIARGAF